MLDAEVYRDDLVRLGLHKIAHQDESLIDHMFRVCSILQDMKAKEQVCVAGLFHGVYGTEGLHNDDVESIPDHRRAEVRRVIGPEIEQMIFNFSVMSYASLGKSFRNVMRPKGVPELKDRRTGEDIPLEREQFLDLLRMKLGDVLAHLPQQVGHTVLDVPTEYAGFWKTAAEWLGPDAISTWNKTTSITGGQLWIDPEEI
ncbi:DUF6817 domain-containing protein [Kitasatospora aureofaciens]|uniref:DUF6817 domain-containing protein n=1 Tax=Kitasatospora aureofaciens TaxID=1894 RepID=A0A1E7N8D7_KITAU|nr:hypothetical protein [Kitasatospora aureofaciens]ARF78614.1 hypothetical protein B6264_06535 [Kitasatospora aureofaciens]OEV36939.1 hypothetical protein HS99_0027160 [Kitasatospora aureofaciens]GGU78824.1 hypothetical protein GCM10010502_33600 [Kitasatospora aureofaciens]